MVVEGTYFIPVKPIGKPRMTRADRWKRRPATKRYWAYKEALREHLSKHNIEELPVVIDTLIFVTRPPKSWSKKKQQEAIGTFHKEKPDWDNQIKAFLDSCHSEDKFISGTCGSYKMYGRTDGIILTLKDIPEAIRINQILQAIDPEIKEILGWNTQGILV